MLAVESGAPAVRRRRPPDRDRAVRGRARPRRRPREGTRRERVTAAMTGLAARVRAAHRRRAGAVVGGLLPDLAGPRGDGASGATPIPEAGDVTDGMTDADAGRADLHIHTLASDGTADGRAQILDHVERQTDLDVIAITDHERIDAAVAARAMAARPRPARRGRRRRGGHDARRAPARAVHRAADPAVQVAALDDRRGPRRRRPGHPGPPAGALPAVRPGLGPAPAPRRPGSRRPPRRARDVQPDGARQAVACPGGPVRRRPRPRAGRQQRRPCASRRSGPGWTTFPGRDAADLRRGDRDAHDRARRLVPRDAGQLGTFGQQLRKRGRDARDEVRGRLRRDGTGRDHGYPGGRLRPPRFEPRAPADPEDGAA